MTLARLSVLPAVVVTAWLLVALPLLLVGTLRPLPSVVLFLPVAVLLVGLAWRTTARPARVAQPLWAVWSLLAVALGFTVINGLFHAEKLILRRDPAAYSQIGHWVAQHGKVTVPDVTPAFGGADPMLTPVGATYYWQDDVIVPQFMSGLPATLAPAEWATSWEAALWVPAVVGGLALLAFGGLVGRLIGPGWAPFGALVLGLAQPFWHVARGTYSEPLAALLLLGGLCLLIDAVRNSDQAAAVLGGLAIGICTVVRVDTLREAVLLVPIIGVLWLVRPPLARPLVAGLAVGLAYGVADALLLTRPYVVDLAPSLLPLLGLLLVLAATTVLAVRGLRRRSVARPAWAPDAAAWLVVAGAAAFVVRPWLQTVHGNAASSAAARDVGRLQVQQGLPLDPTRTYDEWSLYWLSWWVGWATLGLAVVGAALVVRRVLGRSPSGEHEDLGWLAPLTVILGTTTLTLWRPGITPDHPWADRRFVPIVLPGLILLALYGARWFYRRLRHTRLAVPTLGAFGVAMLAPTAFASSPLLDDRVEDGSMNAVRRVCDSFRPGEAVLLVDERARYQWHALLRGACGMPVVGVYEPDPATLDRLVARAQRAGSKPVLVSASSAQPIIDAGVEPRLVLDFVTTEDQKLLTRPPRETNVANFTVWIGRP